MSTDREGNLWIRSAQRFLVRPKGGTRFLPADRGLAPFDGTGASFLEERGRMLVPTDLGLAIGTRDNWRILGEAQGLPGDNVTCVFRDREGSVWLGMGGSGLAR